MNFDSLGGGGGGGGGKSESSSATSGNNFGGAFGSGDGGLSQGTLIAIAVVALFGFLGLVLISKK